MRPSTRNIIHITFILKFNNLHQVAIAQSHVDRTCINTRRPLYTKLEDEDFKLSDKTILSQSDKTMLSQECKFPDNIMLSQPCKFLTRQCCQTDAGFLKRQYCHRSANFLTIQCCHSRANSWLDNVANVARETQGFWQNNVVTVVQVSWQMLSQPCKYPDNTMLSQPNKILDKCDSRTKFLTDVVTAVQVSWQENVARPT
jgi:hypothetical protein